MNLIEPQNRVACERLFQDHKEKITVAKWSQTKHQAWEWGYLDHLLDIFDNAEQLYEIFRRKYDIDYTLWDAILTLFLHDLEKPFKYAWNEDEKAELDSYKDYKKFIRAKAKEYGIILNPQQQNALEYVHGEWSHFNPITRVQLPLAAFIHICDTASARIGYDYSVSWRK